MESAKGAPILHSNYKGARDKAAPSLSAGARLLFEALPLELLEAPPFRLPPADCSPRHWPGRKWRRAAQSFWMTVCGGPPAAAGSVWGPLGLVSWAQLAEMGAFGRSF